tara:strand:+ start:169 stop:501 length:333 start_codon:yes stop_codon:yes gene_type:complete
MNETPTKTVEIEVSVNSSIDYSGKFPNVIWVPMHFREAEVLLRAVQGISPERFDEDNSVKYIANRICKLLQGTGSYLDATDSGPNPEGAQKFFDDAWDAELKQIKENRAK